MSCILRSHKNISSTNDISRLTVTHCKRCCDIRDKLELDRRANERNRVREERRTQERSRIEGMITSIECTIILVYCMHVDDELKGNYFQLYLKGRIL